MARVGKLALPSEDMMWTAVVSMTNEDPDPRYDAQQIKDGDPSTVAKSTETSTVITIGLGSVVTPRAVFLFNTNATTAAIANGAGLNQAIPMPALDADGQRVHPWLDLGGFANVGDDVFTVTLSRPSGVVWIGRIALVTAIYDVNWEADQVRFGVDRPGGVVIQTRLGSLIQHESGIRSRWAEGTMRLEEDAPLYRSLEKAARGSLLPFPFVPFVDVYDAWWVHWPSAFTERMRSPFTEIPIRFQEISNGPPNG